MRLSLHLSTRAEISLISAATILAIVAKFDLSPRRFKVSSSEVMATSIHFRLDTEGYLLVV